jgi:hypothetical protein
MMRLWVLVAVLGVALAGCQLNREARADPLEFALDQEFVLSGGQEAAIRGENLVLRFSEVREDSRCPTQVECVWSGQARIALAVRPPVGEPTTVTFTTSPAPSQDNLTAEVGGGYTIWLRALDPYPQTTAAIPFQDYRATLAARKRAP